MKYISGLINLISSLIISTIIIYGINIATKTVSIAINNECE